MYSDVQKDDLKRRNADMSRVKPVEEDYGKPLTPERLDEMIQRVTGWALLNGAQRKITATEFRERVEPVAITLFPSILPVDVLRKAKSLQTSFQTLIYKVANDHEFMKECFSGLLSVDAFTKQLWDIYETVTNEGPAQEVSFTITRNDFMMESTEEDGAKQDCKQVEINTFAASGCGVANSMVDVHRYSLSLQDFPFEEEQLPENNSIDGLAQGLVKAWQLYKNKRAVILFVVEPCTPDHRWLERGVYRLDRSIKVIYRTFPQLIIQMSFGENRKLIVDGAEVAVVYYRYGYAPKHYPTDAEFKLRLGMERSRAIKCPTVAVHLAGCKKIQQVLAEPGVLERFIDDTDVIKDIRSTFVGLYRLDAKDSSKIITQAIQTPERFVLKPQREGGGSNLFGDDLRNYLEEIKESPERSAWILMDRIQATRHRNRLIRAGLGSECRNVVSELGIFGFHISTPTSELENIECGYLIRTKPEEANEGGLCKGLSCLDTPFLV
ncbi:glutathione synthetase-like isoform X4 [Mercenaria mercenaria]|uniref:glutathione synthetase-like isoform X4 n=1 Tax=Mercenaria mercenaria TaxID=6596 RepID=UPI00234EE945|nr:glutathione synthetase-like isoform X4 [Mercenaria mercenaria]